MKGPVAEALEPWKVEDYLFNINYANDPNYVPSEFALEFVSFIKLVNGSQGEENLTPVVHYKMLDTLTYGGTRILNLCHRGIAKTTLMAEYLFLYIAVYGSIPGFGKIDLALYVSDSIENGIKNMRKNLEFRWENSEFLQEYLPKVKFTDIRWEFRNADGAILIVKGYGAQALSLDSHLYTETGITTMGECQVGDRIYGPDGKLTTITKKSEIFYKPMYELLLEDGRALKVSEDHINSVIVNTNPNNTVRWEEKDLTTKELLEIPLIHTKKGNLNHKGVSNKHLVYVKNSLPLEYPEKSLLIDPYTLGCILGDGSIKKAGSGIVMTAHQDDYEKICQQIPYEQGEPYLDKRTKNVLTWSIKGINESIRQLGLCVHGNYKFIPKEYFFASINQRLELLKGLLDTDGSCSTNGRITFTGNSEKLVKDTASLVRSLGGKAKVVKVAGRSTYYKAEIWMGINPFKLPRKAQRFNTERFNWDRVAIKSITSIPMEASQCIAVDNEDRQYLSTEYFRTHNTGVRGAKEMGKRPQLAVLDDLISDEDARSSTVIAAVEDTVYKAVTYALHPDSNMIIWSGTPYNSKDPLYKAVESGAWAVNVFPVCEAFPCEEKDFKGSWPDRFSYKYVKTQYDLAFKSGKIASFNQELMLRIMSDEDRVIQDSDICWYNLDTVLKNKGWFNFYITTDFATSESQKSDYSVISVWAHNYAGDWLWVDGICKRQLMDKNVDDLFRLAQMYKPQGVGIEVSGQQGGFVQWIQNQMMQRNIYFSLSSDSNSGKPGIRPNTNKLMRFNTVVPLFKLRKIFFPLEKKNDPAIAEAINELSLVSVSGFKSKHDDFCDTVSMLPLLNAWKPSEEVNLVQNEESSLWEVEEDEEIFDRRTSYIV